MKILILGVNSYVGSRIYFELRGLHTVIGTFNLNNFFKDFVKLDITNNNEVQYLISREKPDVIIHAANNAGGKLFTENPNAAINLNIESTNYVVKASQAVGAKLIYISSFAALPANIPKLYGETKLASEKIIKDSGVQYSIIRPSIIIGCSPKMQGGEGVFHAIINNLDRHQIGQYDNYKKYQPSYIYHVYEVIKEVISRRLWNTTIHVAVPEAKTKFDVAQSILTPFDVGVKPVDEHLHGSQIHDLEEIEQLGLPKYKYADVIKMIVEEIKCRGRFKL